MAARLYEPDGKQEKAKEAETIATKNKDIQDNLSQTRSAISRSRRVQTIYRKQRKEGLWVNADEDEREDEREDECEDKPTPRGKQKPQSKSVSLETEPQRAVADPVIVNSTSWASCLMYRAEHAPDTDAVILRRAQAEQQPAYGSWLRIVGRECRSRAPLEPGIAVTRAVIRADLLPNVQLLTEYPRLPEMSAISSAASKAVRSASGGTLAKGARRDPELYILLGVMSSAFGLAGYYFGRKPTSSNSESEVAVAANSKPWETKGSGGGKDGQFKYQYHPGGNLKNPPKDAPSALNVVIVPNVNLPKELHDKHNKWGKDDY
ncbi:MAG: hypothetical protein M1840_004105 [Geoglossum simile]|nr:MAG: hypothetical protein M1840_004105 [Geoglossum simile]